jgi:hypothetical protein
MSSCPIPKTVKIKMNRTKILSTVLHGYDTWFLTLIEKHRLSVFKNTVLQRIFGFKRKDVI